jgi:hypothetical protein
VPPTDDLWDELDAADATGHIGSSAEEPADDPRLPDAPRNPELVRPGLFCIEDPPGWASEWSHSVASWPWPFEKDDLDDPCGGWWEQPGDGAVELSEGISA